MHRQYLKVQTSLARCQHLHRCSEQPAQESKTRPSLTCFQLATALSCILTCPGKVKQRCAACRMINDGCSWSWSCGTSTPEWNAAIINVISESCGWQEGQNLHCEKGLWCVMKLRDNPEAQGLGTHQGNGPGLLSFCLLFQPRWWSCFSPSCYLSQSQSSSFLCHKPKTKPSPQCSHTDSFSSRFVMILYSTQADDFSFIRAN